MQGMPKELDAVELSRDDQALDGGGKAELAARMVTDDEYAAMKSRIVTDVDDCFTSLVEDLARERAASFARERTLQVVLMASLVMGAVLIVVDELADRILVMRPMRAHDANIRNDEPLDIVGCQEIRAVAASYNRLYEENRRRTALLRRQAATDALTGLLNRGSFDLVLDHAEGDVALVVVDVDLFKQINDGGGHEMGDKVLKKVARALAGQFRATDYVCRIGGDEFAVVLQNEDYLNRDALIEQFDATRRELCAAAENQWDQPNVAMGVAVYDPEIDGSVSDTVRRADKVMYENKRVSKRGR